jgi:hypothetical protein
VYNTRELREMQESGQDTRQTCGQVEDGNFCVNERDISGSVTMRQCIARGRPAGVCRFIVFITLNG